MVEKIRLPLEMTEEYIDGKRHYLTPEGKLYPSITTVLDIDSREIIERWKARVGEEEAERVAKRAAAQGSRLHDTCEAYLENKEDTLIEVRKADPIFKTLFFSMKKYLDRIESVYLSESRLYSDRYELAGRCDVIGIYEGKLSVIDFKTIGTDTHSLKIPKYFAQTAGYLEMYEQHYPERIEQLVIIFVSNTTETKAKTTTDIETHLDHLWEIRQKYKKLYGV
jgi:genome maintenance exonuclease 1